MQNWNRNRAQRRQQPKESKSYLIAGLTVCVAEHISRVEITVDYRNPVMMKIFQRQDHLCVVVHHLDVTELHRLLLVRKRSSAHKLQTEIPVALILKHAVEEHDTAMIQLPQHRCLFTVERCAFQRVILRRCRVAILHMLHILRATKQLSKLKIAQAQRYLLHRIRRSVSGQGGPDVYSFGIEQRRWYCRSQPIILQKVSGPLRWYR